MNDYKEYMVTKARKLKDPKDKIPDRVYHELINGPRPVKKLTDWRDLGEALADLDVTPQMVARIVREKISDDNTRFNWKMIRLTLYVWERDKEDREGYLKPKIDTVKAVVGGKKFMQFFEGYYPDIAHTLSGKELVHHNANEVRALNKLIAEKSQKELLLTEGNFFHEGQKNRRMTKAHLQHILRL